MPVLYKLILWTLGCTSADPDCLPGDYYVHEMTYTAKVQCEESIEAVTWEGLDENNRSACINKARLESLERIEQLEE
jgi:hypothetical protein